MFARVPSGGGNPKVKVAADVCAVSPGEALSGEVRAVSAGWRGPGWITAVLSGQSCSEDPF